MKFYIILGLKINRKFTLKFGYHLGDWKYWKNSCRNFNWTFETMETFFLFFFFIKLIIKYLKVSGEIIDKQTKVHLIKSVNVLQF